MQNARIDEEREEMFDAWVYRLHSIARNPPLTGSYHQLSHLVRDIYEKGWKDADAFKKELE
jgi:hypothetical protein